MFIEASDTRCRIFGNVFSAPMELRGNDVGRPDAAESNQRNSSAEEKDHGHDHDVSHVYAMATE
jgi:hypothetical protein